MKPATPAALLLLAAASAVPARPPADPKGPPVDTSFLKRYAETRGFLLGRPAKPKVTPDGRHVLFLRAARDNPRQSLYEFDPATGQTREVLSADAILKGGDEKLTPEEKARRERQRVSAGGFADFHLNHAGSHVLVNLGNTLYLFDRAAASVLGLKSEAAGAIVDPKWSPDGKLVAFVRGYDVVVYDLTQDRERPVTTVGTALKTHGLAEFVAQEEMGRFSGYWWSPDSKSIAYAEADHAGVETWWIADPLKPDQKPQEQFYPRPGKKNVSVRLGVVPVGGGPTVWVEWDRAKYEYLAAVQWDEFHGLTLQVQDRTQHTLALLKADPATGKTTQLLTETDPAWVNLPAEVPRWSGALGGFVWVGKDAAGDPEVQLRDADGKLSDVLVPAKAHPADVQAVYSTRFQTFVVYTAHPDPTRKVVYRHQQRSRIVDPGSEKDESLSPAEGVSTAVLAKHGGTAVVTTTTLRQLPKSVALKADGTVVGELPSVAAEPELRPDVTVEKVGDYWTAVVRPRDFDPTKKYPVVLDVYGGPRHLHVVRAMRNWLVPQWLADQGFVVVAVDNRGTPSRGREWERAVYQQFGTVPLDDQVKGLDALFAKHKELDRERVGIVGWSFGGYMAANGVLRRPEVFKAAVAGAPVTDWEDYDTHYTERYMGLLPASAAAYREASLLPLAPKLERPLLLVHGTADDNVYYRHTLRLSDALFRAGRPFEALALPGVTHMYSADPAVMERLWSRTAGFFRTHLGGPR